MSSSESSSPSLQSDAADSRPKEHKQKGRAPRAVLHINPSSWQPVLLFALVEESKEFHKSAEKNGLSPEQAITDYLLSDRGWRLLEVLSQTHWKDIEVPGLSKHDLLGLLSGLFLSLDWLNSDKDVTFTEWDHFLVPESKLLETKTSKKILTPLGPESQGPVKPTKKQPKKPRYWDFGDWEDYRESAQREVNMEEEQQSSTEETVDDDQHKKATGAPAKAPPYILQEDSDGFPLCWNEDAPLPGFEGGKLWLDDMILDMLHYQLELKTEKRSETGAALMVLALMKKAVGCFMSSPYFTDEDEREKFCLSAAEFTTRALKWTPANVMVMSPKESDYDSKSVSMFLRSLLLSRHWADTIMAVVTALAAATSLCERIVPDVLLGIRALLDQLSSVCHLLTECSRDLAQAALDGAMEFLLESGHRLAVGLPCTVDASLQMFVQHQLADHLQVAGQILGVFSEGEYLESLRDLAIAMDLLAQVNYKPPRSRTYSESGASIVSRYMDNAYQSRLYCLLLSVASLSARLQEAKTLWLHCSMCRRTTHDRCSLNQTPMVGHHHGILEFPEKPSQTPGFVPLENRTREEISERCACAYLIRVLFECLKNVRDMENKELAYMALQCTGNCCCISPEILMTNLLADLRELSATSQKHLLRSLKTHLHPHVQLSIDGRALSCRMCDKDETNGLLERGATVTGGYVAVLEGFFKTSDEAALIRLCRLVWSILPTLTAFSREAICAQAVVPCLMKMCEKVLRKDPPNLLTGMRRRDDHPDEAHSMDSSRHMKLTNSLLGLSTAALHGEVGYSALMTLFHPFGELLFYCPDTQGNFMHMLKAGALLESQLAAATPSTACGEQIRTHEWPLNKFLYDKFLMAFKLCDKDLSNLIGESASQFWLVVSHVLELCRVLLARSTGFEMVFGRYDGRNRCLQLISSCLSQMTQSGGEDHWTDSKSAQRLTSLLGQVLSLALMNPSGYGAKEELLERLSKVFVEYGSRKEDSWSKDAEEHGAGRPFLAHRLCAMLIDCSLGIPVSTEYPTRPPSTRKKSKSKGTKSESDTSVETTPPGESESMESEPFMDEDDGYEGDVEIGTFESQNTLLSSPALQHPELCRLALRYLLVSLDRLGPQSARDFVATSIVQKLSLICFNNPGNLTSLREQGVVEILHTLAMEFAHRSGDVAVLKSIMDLLTLFMRQKPDSDDLEKIIKMLRIENTPEALVIDTLLSLLNQTTLEPSECLVFPQVSNATQQKQKAFVSSNTGGWRNVLSLQRPKSFSPKKALAAKRAPTTTKPGMFGRSESIPATTAVERSFTPFFSGFTSLFLSTSKTVKSQPGTAGGKQALPPMGISATLPKASKKKSSMGTRKGAPPSPTGAAASTDAAPDAAVVLLAESSTFGGSNLTLEEGVTVSLWLKVDRTVNKSVTQDDTGPFGNWLHALSVGTEDLSVGIYEHPENEYTALRIMSKGEMVQERRYKKLFSHRKWVHMVLSVSLAKRETLKVQMYANGVARHSWELAWQCEDLGFYLPCYVGLGCLSDQQRSSDAAKLEVGNLLGFRGCVSHEAAVFMCGLGPRCSSLADTKARTLASSVYPLLKPALLCQELNMMTLLEDQDGVLESLQKSQVLCYLPSTPSQFSMYFLPLQQQTAPDSSGPAESYLSLVRVRQFPAEVRCPLVESSNTSIEDAFATLGGARLLIMIFGWVVDSGASEWTQAKALRLLLTGVQRQPEWWRTFCNLQGYGMVAKVLASPQCVKGDMLLHEICCASMFGVPESSEGLSGALEEGSFWPIVQNPEIISALMGNPDVWKTNRASWESALGILAKSLDEENLYASFNAMQLNRAGFLKKLLLVCLDVTQESKLEQPSPSVAQYLVPVIQALLGSPPELSHLTAFWDFLFLSHPAACTYLNYRISGHSDWANVDLLGEELINLVRYESPLSRKLRQYFIVVGQERLSTLMAENNGSVSATRREFEKAAGDQPSFSYDGTSHETPEESKKSAEEKESEVSSAELWPEQPPSTEQPPVQRLRDSFPRLPDLVCDIDSTQGASATTTGSDSGGEWSQDEVTTEGYTTATESEEKLVKQEEANWIVETRAGLLEVLSVVLLTGPDALVSRLAGPIVKWEPLVVMLNHQPNSRIRGTCVKALCALLLRSDDSFRVKFMKSHGFSLLANQIREFPCTTPIADSLFSVLCGEPLRLEEGLDAGHLVMMTVNRFQCGVLEPVLALFENCTHDTTLFWNVASNLQKIFENNAVLAQALLDNHLVEALVNVLITLSKMDMRQPSEVSGMPETGLLIECWHSLASKVLQSCLAFADLIHHQACVEFFTLMFDADWQAYREGTKTQHGTIRKQLCSLLQISLENIRTLYSEDGLSASAMISMESVATGAFGSRTGSRAGSRSGTPNASGRSSPVHSEVSSSHGSFSYSFHTASPQQSPGILGGSFSNLKQKLMNLSGSGSHLSVPMGGGRGRNERQKIAAHSELVERLKLCIQYCADVFLHLPPGDPTSDEEEHLFEFYVYFLVTTAKECQKDSRRAGRKSIGTKTWQRLIYACKDRVRLLLAHLVAFVLFPAAPKLAELDLRRKKMSMGVPDEAEMGTSGGAWQDGEKRGDWVMKRQLFLARALAHEVQYKQMLKSLLDINLDYQFAMNIALHELILVDNNSSRTSKSERADVEKLLRFLRHLKISSPLDKLNENRLHNLSTDEQLCLQTYQELRQTWLQKMRQGVSRLKLRQSSAAEPVSETAMTVTCSVVEDQNVPRKLFIQHSKVSFAENIQADEHWRALVADLCHPCGPCYDPKSWPPSWGLDPTEGPCRERRRLAPCHLGIPKEFILPSELNKLESQEHLPPLANLLSKLPPVDTGMDESPGWDPADLAGQLIDRLRIDEKIAFSTRATIIRSTFECTGEILLGDQRIYFVGESSKTAQKGLPQTELISMSWPYAEVVEVYKRYHQLLDTAVEVFFSDGETYLISFDSIEKRNFFLHRLLTMELPNLTTYSDNLLQALTQWWREGNITNFEYLMHLNKLDGRTFSDLMQYPVFPFILADYTSLSLDLSSPIVYRDLAKPIAIQDRKMEDHYIKVYKQLEIEARRAPAAAWKSIPHFGPYHYGSHYSNSGIVVHYLVRVPPFTRMALEYQDNNFDIPDRLFASLETTWRLASQESTTDFKELIPEFFFWPDFLTNFEGLNLGKRQTGAVVSDVELPPWVPNGDPRLFVMVHRQALESHYVTAYLNMWIDLVFGYKQAGQAAIEAINVFHPATYHGTQLAAETTDELHRTALKAMVRTYGQMPRQLFKVPHQPHFHVKAAHLPQKTSKSPLDSISGIRWGVYVGSPDAGEPVLVLKQRSPASSDLKPTSLQVISELTCLGLPASCDLLVRFRTARQGEVTPLSLKEVDSLAVVYWAFSDGVVRGRLLSPEPGGPWVSLIALHDQKVSASAYSSSNNRLFLGLKSGILRVYKIEYQNLNIKSCHLEKELYGHRGSVMSIAVCSEYSVIVSGCTAGQVLMWDLNRLNFVRALTPHGGMVSHCAISKTTCDVATVCQIGYGSQILLHSVNGRLIGYVDTDIAVCSVAISNVPEGTGVNCIAAGLQNGIIRLWNSWTLAPMRDVMHSSFFEPIISLTYAHNSKKLYACTKSGTVLCWEATSSKHSKPPRYVFANPRL